MPERPKGAVLKTAVRKYRGFESLSLRMRFYCAVLDDLCSAMER